MNDLLSKLNTLARAKLSDALPSLPQLPRFERAPDLQRQVTDLRQRINDALDHEDQLQAQVNALRDEAAQLDAEADQALVDGRDDVARRILEQLKKTEQRLSFAESDLKMHQRDAAELILKVNQLEAAVADHQAAVSGMAESTSPPTDYSTTYTPPAVSTSSSTPERSTSRLERPPEPLNPPTTASVTNTPVTNTPAANVPATPAENTPVENTPDAAPASDTPVAATPTARETSPAAPLDTSFAANSDELPEVVSGETQNTASAPAAPAAPTDTGTEAKPAETQPTADAKPAQPDEEDDQRETAKSYAKRAREAALEQTEKTTSSVDQISDIIRDAQEKTRARIQSLTDILEAKDREQAASPLYNREKPQTSASSPAASTSPATTPPASDAPSDAPATAPTAPAAPAPALGGEGAPKSDDTISERLKRLSKPDA